MEKDFCKKCGKCCQNINVNFETKTIYFDGIQKVDDSFLSMLETINKEGEISHCKCKFLENNLCNNISKPEICKNFPSSPFAFLPSDCGWEGEIFTKKEQIMQKIRKLKEEIIHYEALILSSSNKSEQNQYNKIIDSHKKNIERYKNYGSDLW